MRWAHNPQICGRPLDTVFHLRTKGLQIMPNCFNGNDMYVQNVMGGMPIQRSPNAVSAF